MRCSASRSGSILKLQGHVFSFQCGKSVQKVGDIKTDRQGIEIGFYLNLFYRFFMLRVVRNDFQKVAIGLQSNATVFLIRQDGSALQRMSKQIDHGTS